MEERKPNIEVHVQWKSQAKTPKQLELNRHLEERDMNYDLVKTADILVRPAAVAAEVRDIIRARFSMDTIDAQIHTLQVLSSETNIMQEKWSLVQEVLWAPDAGKPVFQMTLRLREEGEVLWENEEIPGLSKTVLVTDGEDVHPKVVPQTSDDDDDDGSHNALVDTINRCAGTSVDTLDKMLKKHFGGRKEDLLKFFTVDGKSYDVETPEGRLGYHRKVMEELTSRDHVQFKDDSKSRSFGKTQLTPAQLQLFNDAKQDGQLAVMSLPDGGEARHYTLNAVHTGTQGQVGLPIEPSAIVLQMTAFKASDGRLMYRSALPGLEKTSFYPYQVSGCVAMLVAMFGYVPLPENATDEVRKVAQKLRGLAIGGKFLCDQTGMGKSKLSLLTIYFAQYHITRNKDHQRIYKYTKLAVPSGVIKQWADAIIDDFPTLHLMISYDDSGLGESKYARHFIKSTAMKNMEHQELWPERHRYIFDKTDPRTGATIILTTHDTLPTRTLKGEKVIVKEGRRYDPDVPATEEFDPHEKHADGTPKHWAIPPVEQTQFFGNQKGMVGISMLDEAHRHKDKESMRWKAFKELEGDYVVVIGATPMANVGVVSGSKNQFLKSANLETGRNSPTRTPVACCSESFE
jgi:hypothetical protein